jgi:hypothetical protein
MYSGRVPFEGLSEGKTVLCIVRGERPVRPSMHTPGGYMLEPPDDVWDLIMRCWSHDCEARPPIADVCASLENTAVQELTT